MNGHIEHLKVALKSLRAENLYGNLNKCSFCMYIVHFLGFVVSAKGVEGNGKKIKANRDWPTPTTITNVRSFHSIVGFSQRHID